MWRHELVRGQCQRVLLGETLNSARPGSSTAAREICRLLGTRLSQIGRPVPGFDHHAVVAGAGVASLTGFGSPVTAVPWGDLGHDVADLVAVKAHGNDRVGAASAGLIRSRAWLRLSVSSFVYPMTYPPTSAWNDAPRLLK
jgi:hypothetical protein